MLNLIRHKKGKTRKERDREKEEQVMSSRESSQERQEGERPSSRSSCRSDKSDRPSSRTGRTKQPVLGTLGYPGHPGLFEDDPGVMSEVETSSSRLRRGAKERNSYAGSVATRPRTSPSQPSRSPGPGGGSHPGPGGSHQAKVCNNNNTYYLEDDPGIMSEAETSSTRVKRGGLASGHVSNMNTTSLGRGGCLVIPSQHMHSSMFDDDPGIMSEAETASTRRKNKPKAVLPVVRTPSKTLERPLGLVFLVYRGETKRALLPNEITVIDTVKALFVRSFGRALTMEYLDSPRVKIYIHDSAKDIFYELENLTEIKDRTILKLFETDGSGRGPSGLGPAGLPPFTPTPFETGEPFPSEPAYVTSAFVRDQKRVQKLPADLENSFPQPLVLPQTTASSTLPRNVFSNRENPYEFGGFPGNDLGDIKSKDGMSTSGILSNVGGGSRTMPARSKTLGPGFMRGSGGSNKVQSGYASSPDSGGPDFSSMRVSSRFSSIPEGSYPGPVNAAEAKERMMAMEQQLSQLTGMVQKALNNKKTGGKKTVSFEKSVSFSDDPPPPPGILSKKDGGRGSSSGRGGLGRGGSLKLPENKSSDDKKKTERNSVVSMEPELYNQLRGLQKSARELRQEVRVLRRLSQLQSMAMKDLVNDTYLKLREAVIVFAAENKYGGQNDFEKIKISEDEDLFCQGLSELLRELKELEVNVEDIRSGVINKKNKISIQDVENLALMLSRSSKSVTELQRKLPVIQQKLTTIKHTDEHEEKKRIDKFQNDIPENLDNAWKRCRKVTGTLVTLKRLASVQEQRIHPGAPIDVSLSPTPSEIARLPTGSDTGKESSLDDLLDALQNYSNSEGSNPDSCASEPPELEKSQSSTSSGSTNPPPAPTNPNLLKAPLGRLPSYPSTEVGSPVKQPPPVSTEPPPCPPRTTTKGAPPPPPPRTSSTGSKSKSKDAPSEPPYSKPHMPSPAYMNTKMVVEQTAASSLNRTVSAEPEKESMSPRRSIMIVNPTKVKEGIHSHNNLQPNGNNLSRSESSSSDSVNSQDGIIQFKRSGSLGAWSGQGPPPIPSKPEAIKNLNSKKRQDELEQRHQELLARQKQLQEQYQRLQSMQKKANNMPPTTATSCRDSVNALKKTGSDSSLAEIKSSEVPTDKSKNCNTLPMQSSSKNSESLNNNSKVNGTKVKFSTLPSPNKTKCQDDEADDSCDLPGGQQKHRTSIITGLSHV